MENKDNFSVALSKIISEAGLMSYTTTANNICTALKILGKNEVKLNNQITIMQKEIDELKKKIPEDNSAELKMLNDNMVYLKKYIGNIIDYMKQFNLDVEAKFDDIRRNTVTKEPEPEGQSLREKLIDVFDNGFSGTAKELSEQLNAPIGSVWNTLARLVKQGTVKKNGEIYQKEI